MCVFLCVFQAGFCVLCFFFHQKSREGVHPTLALAQTLALTQSKAPTRARLPLKNRNIFGALSGMSRVFRTSHRLLLHGSARVGSGGVQVSRVGSGQVIRFPSRPVKTSLCSSRKAYLVVRIVADGICQALEHGVKQSRLQKRHLLNFEVLLRSFPLLPSKK